MKDTALQLGIRLTTEEAAAYCRVTPLVLTRAGREGRVARIKVGRTVLFTVEDLDQWLADCREEAVR